MRENIIEDYNRAKDFFLSIGVNTEETLKRLQQFSLSIQCWQGDDVGGFETPDAELSGGGIQVTGNYPGKARNISELKNDLEKVFTLVPGRHRFNLHAIYGDFGGKFVERDQIEKEHFESWMVWANKNKIKLDFNATLFSHPKADSGYTLSSRDKDIRDFWIEHVKRARRIAAYFGERQKASSVHNLWIPDGMKDIPYDRWTPREILKESLDEIYKDEYPDSQLKDAVESKLFGIGSESYVVGSHDFYLGYALTRNKMICLDMGHFHLTENVADKISSILQYSDELLFHISRPVRWDSDHIPILSDELKETAAQIIRYNLDNRVNIALDFFDATVNRIGAYVIGVRSMLKALLTALLEPKDLIYKAEIEYNYLKRLSMLEEIKFYPIGAVWDYYCEMNNTPLENEWLHEVELYEKSVLSKRN